MKHYHPSSLVPLGLLALLLALLSGCAKEKPKSAGVPAQKVRFTYQDRVADAASMIAVEKGFFRAEGLEVKPLAFSNGPACSEALFSGAADIGTMGDTTAVIAVSRSPVKIIASHGGGENRHRIIVAKDSPIHSPADLIGKRLAVKKGTSTYGGLLAWAQSVDLDLSKVKVVEMCPGDMGDALLSGAVDAIVASEPTPSLVEQRGGRQLATLGGLGNSYPILLVARDEYLKAHPETVKAFLRAMRRATQFIKEHPDEAAQVVAAKAGLPLEVAKRSMGYHYYSLQLDEKTRNSLRMIAQFLVKEKILEEIPDWTSAIDDQYLAAASQ